MAANPILLASSSTLTKIFNTSQSTFVQASIVTATGSATGPAITAKPDTTTATFSSTLTDSSPLASSISQSSQALSQTTVATTTHNAASTSSASSVAATSSKTNSIIPAVVVPVAILLLASLGLFWFFMRRRHRRELRNQPEFIMASKRGKMESITESTPSSLNSHSAHKTLPMTSIIPIIPPAVPSSPPPLYSNREVGMARAISPQNQQPPRPDSASGSTSSPGHKHIAQFAVNPPAPGAAPNFSSPRPIVPHPPNPSVQNRGRADSAPQNRGSPPIHPPNNGPGLGSNSRARTSPVSPDQSQLPATPMNIPAAARNLSNNSPYPHNRAAPPAPITAPPPGAFNGVGPISQYSPIVKENPHRPFPSMRPLLTQNLNRQGQESPIPATTPSDAGSGHIKASARSDLTEENLRIAHLGLGGQIRAHNNDDHVDALSAVSSLNEDERQRLDREAWNNASPTGADAHIAGGMLSSLSRRVSRDEDHHHHHHHHPRPTIPRVPLPLQMPTRSPIGPTGGYMAYNNDNNNNNNGGGRAPGGPAGSRGPRDADDEPPVSPILPSPRR